MAEILICRYLFVDKTIQIFLTLLTGQHQFSTFSLALILKEIFTIFSESIPKSATETTAKASLTQIVSQIFTKMVKFGNISERPADSDETLEKLKQDAAYTLQYLSAVSTLDNPRRQELSLELLLSVLTNVGSVFLDDDRFFKIIESRVIDAVSKNSITSNHSLFESSLSIFLLLMRYYRHKIKGQVEVSYF